jgi:DNA replication protein DnaC
MGDLAYLRTKVEPIVEQSFSRPFAGFAIHEWMFDAKPYLVSRDNPASLRYVCQECGLVEPKHVANGWIRRRCACELALYEQTSHAEFKAESQALADTEKTSRTYTWLGDAEDDLTDKTFVNFTRDYQIKAYDECENWTKRFLQARQYTDTFSLNVLLMGGYGTGKTHLATAILNTLRAQNIPCLFCTAQNFFNALYGQNFEGKAYLIEQASMAPLLAIDELDKLYFAQKDDPELSGAFQKRTLFDILDKRYKRRLPTIITTNEQKDLGMWLDGATISRLYERVTLLPMNGVDYRSRQK